MTEEQATISGLKGRVTSLENTVRQLSVEIDMLVGLLSAYIHENTHPNCLPAMRYRVIQPSGFSAYFSTRYEAQDFLMGYKGHEQSQSHAGQDQAIATSLPVNDQTTS